VSRLVRHELRATPTYRDATKCQPLRAWIAMHRPRRLDSWRRRGPKPASLEAEALQEPWAEPNRHIERRKTLVA
jgi:hypothetical protein